MSSEDFAKKNRRRQRKRRQRNNLYYRRLLRLSDEVKAQGRLRLSFGKLTLCVLFCSSQYTEPFLF